MTLTEAVVIINRELEELAKKEDYTMLEKLSFVKKNILEHQCRKPRKK